MPNFNGAIIMHTLQLLNAPATLREIVMTIAKHTEVPQEELKLPVKQTLEMGQRFGFLQKVDGRYYVEPMSFTRLLSEIRAIDTPDIIEKPKPTKGDRKSVQKAPLKTVVEKKLSQKLVSNTEPMKTPNPMSKKSLADGAIKNFNPIPKKPVNDGAVKNSNPIPKNPLNDGTVKNSHPIPKNPLHEGSSKNLIPFPKMALNSDVSIASSSKTIVASKEKSVTSLAKKTRRLKEARS